MISFLLVLILKQLSSSPGLSRPTIAIASSEVCTNFLCSVSVTYVRHEGRGEVGVLQAQAGGQARLDWDAWISSHYDIMHHDIMTIMTLWQLRPADFFIMT